MLMNFSKIEVQKGIWQYQKIAENIPKRYRITIGEGDTPLQKIQIGTQSVFVKREDLNPNKSFKDRTMVYMISKYVSEGIKNFSISSSGNAAISAGAICTQAKVRLDVFVSKKIVPYKNSRLVKLANQGYIVVHYSNTPKSDAIKWAKTNNSVNLRGSSDNSALVGSMSIAFELTQKLSSCDAIFLCVSSGANLVGIYNGLRESYYSSIDMREFKFPSFHIVQTTKINPMASSFDRDFVSTKTSLSDAISDRVAKRRTQVLEIVKATSGRGWVISDEELKKTKKSCQSSGVVIEGYNAYLSIAGFLKATRNGYDFECPLCLVTGI